jgi:hypothetical protein
MEILGEIFDACRISATHISAPKIYVSLSIEHFFVCSTIANLFGAEIGVAEIRQASKFSPNISIIYCIQHHPI